MTSGLHARPRLRFSLPLDPARLLRARQRIRDYLHDHELEPRAIDDIVLAIQEAMTNAVRHSGVADDLEVILAFSGADLAVLVRDHGRGFDVTTFDPHELPDLERPHGRGLFLISRLMDGLELINADGLEVRAVKRNVLPAATHDDQPLLSPSAQAHRQARTESMLEEIDEGFYALDWEYRYLSVNGADERLFGRSRDELLGLTIAEGFPGLLGTPVLGTVREAMELGRPGILEYLSPTVRRWLEMRVYPTSSGVIAYIRDIDERKRKELERDEMRRRSELLAQTSARLLSAGDPQAIIDELCRDVMAYLDCDVFFNYLVEGEAGLRLNAYAGTSPETAQTIARLEFGEAVCGCAAAEERRIVAEDIQHNDDQRSALVRALGVQVYAAHPLVARGVVLGTLSFGARNRTRFTPADLDLMQTVAGYVAIAVDRQRADRALRQSEARLHIALGGAPVVVFSQDRDLRYTWVDNAAPGCRAEDVLGKTDADVYAADDARAFTAIKRQVLATGVTRRDEVVTHRPATAGGDLVHDMTTEALRDEAGAIVGVLCAATDITSHRHTQAALREAEARAAELVRLAPVGIYEIDFTVPCFKSVNDYMCRMLGYRREELLAMNPMELLEPESRTRFRERVGRARAGERPPEETDYSVRTRDGRVLEAALSISFTMRDGVIDGALVVARDVSQQVRAEEALRQSEERFRLALRNAPVSVAAQDLDLRYTWAYNQRSATAEEIIGRRDADLFTPAEVERLTAVKRRVIAEDVQLSETMWLDRPKGPMYLQVFWEPLHDAAGNVVGVGNATLDLTQMKLTEDALRESEERFRAFFNSAAFGVVQVDREGRFLEVNDRYCAITGYTRQELLQMAASDLAPSEDYHRDREQLMAYLGTEEPFDVEKRYVRKDGGQVWVHVRAGMIHDAGGRPVGSAAVVQDVTERRRAEAELRTLYESQRDVSLTLQRSFLHHVPALPGLRVGLVEVPSATPALVGGDLWDLVDLGGRRVLALIGDVAGSGIEAAGLTWTVRAAVQALAKVTADPGYILTKANALLLDRQPEGSHVTALLLVLDTESGELSFASAGHPGPVCLAGQVAGILEPAYGTPLGAWPAEYETRRALLPHGSSLVLYTDGITEARRGGRVFGEHGLLEALPAFAGRDAQEIAEGVRRAAEGFAGRFCDDAEVLVLQADTPARAAP